MLEIANEADRMRHSDLGMDVAGQFSASVAGSTRSACIKHMGGI